MNHSVEEPANSKSPETVFIEPYTMSEQSEVAWLNERISDFWFTFAGPPSARMDALKRHLSDAFGITIATTD